MENIISRYLFKAYDKLSIIITKLGCQLDANHRGRQSRAVINQQKPGRFRFPSECRNKV